MIQKKKRLKGEPIPSWLLVFITVLTVGAAIAALVMPWIREVQPSSGYLEPELTIDLQPVPAPERLLYREDGMLYVDAALMDSLLPEIEVSQAEQNGALSLLVSDAAGRELVRLQEGGKICVIGEEPLYNRVQGTLLRRGGEVLVPLENAQMLFGCLIQWEEEGMKLALQTKNYAKETIAALVNGYGFLLSEAVRQEPFLFAPAFPVEDEQGQTLFSLKSGALFPSMPGSFTPCHYGYLYRGPDGSLGLYSIEGVLLLSAQYRAIEFPETDADLVVTTDPIGMQRLWMASEGGILPLTDQDCLAVGHGYSFGGEDGGPALIEDMLIALRRVDGAWGVMDLKSGKMCLPYEYEAIGAYMDVGHFTYQTEDGSAALSGEQPSLTLWYETEDTRALVVRKNGLWGAVDLEGNEQLPFVYDAIFSAPFGENPGWYGLREREYILLNALEESRRPVLDNAAQLALSGAGLLLLERQKEGCLVADTSTGTAYLLPHSTGERLFGDAPLFTVVQVAQRDGQLAVAEVPTPPYALYPVLPLGSDREKAALTYADALLKDLLYRGDALGLLDYSLGSVSILEEGEFYLTLALNVKATPQRETGKGTGCLWGETDSLGSADLSLRITVYEGKNEAGTSYLCAAGPDEQNPFTGLPPAAEWAPVSYRYEPTPLAKRYTELMAGGVEEHVFYEDSRRTLVEERRLEKLENTAGYRYRITLSAIEGEERITLFDMPDAMGEITVLDEGKNGFLVTTWHHAYASSGWEGSLGYLTDAGFSPILERAFLIGRRGQTCYFVGQRDGVRGIYRLSEREGILHFLCPLPGEDFSTVRRSLFLQSITNDSLTLAWPDARSSHRYTVYRISLPYGDTKRLWPNG